MKNISISPEQCRAARAFLNWGQAELAERSGITVNPIVNFERGSGSEPEARTLRKIARAFELAGIEFTSSGGIERRNDTIVMLEGENAVFELMQDVYLSLKDRGGEVLIAGLQEPDASDTAARQAVAKHIERLQSAGITERILTEPDNTNLIAPSHWHRSLAEVNFRATPYQQYGDKLAFIDWEPEQKVLIIHHARIAQTFRTLFDALWKRADLIETKGGQR